LTSLISLLSLVMTEIQASPLCRKAVIVETKEFSADQFFFKIRGDFPNLPNYPHHYHDEQGGVYPSQLIGDPVQDIPIVLQALDEWLSQR